MKGKRLLKPWLEREWSTPKNRNILSEMTELRNKKAKMLTLKIMLN